MEKLNGRLALVADDDLVTLSVIEQTLQSLGVQVLAARDGAEAVGLFDSHEGIQLVVCDMRMPKLGGLDVCRHVRARERQQHTPFVLFTAEEDTDIEVAAAAGIDDFLPKPLRHSELIIRVRSLLRMFDMQQATRQGYELLEQEHALLVQTRGEFGRVRDLIVHDLKNPLASLLTNTRYMLERVAAEDRETMLDIIYATENVHRIVDNMSDISKAGEKPLSVSRTMVDVAQLLTEWVREQAPMVELNMRRIALVGAGTPVRAAVDAAMLRRVLDNLLDNCMRYAPMNSTVTFSLETTQEHELLVCAHDMGTPVPEAARAELFEISAFLRERATGPGRRQGRGLGFVFCKLAVGAHGGRIWVEPGSAGGNCFCFTLPTGYDPAL